MQTIKLTKIIQLIITVSFDTAIVLSLYLDPALRYRVFTDRHLFILCVLFWMGSLFSLLFLYLDLTQLLKVAARADSQE